MLLMWYGFFFIITRITFMIIWHLHVMDSVASTITCDSTLSDIVTHKVINESIKHSWALIGLVCFIAAWNICSVSLHGTLQDSWLKSDSSCSWVHCFQINIKPCVLICKWRTINTLTVAAIFRKLTKNYNLIFSHYIGSAEYLYFGKCFKTKLLNIFSNFFFCLKVMENIYLLITIQ